MLRKNLFRTLCGSALALAWVIGCGDDGSSGGGGTGGDATSTGGDGSGTGGDGSGTGGTNSTGGNTSTGGTAGDTGDCDSGEDVLPLGLYTPSMGGMGGMGGGAGDDGPFGWNFAEEGDVDLWGVKDTGDCTTCTTATDITFTCGTILVDVDWPEAANTSYVSTYLEANPPEGQRWNLEGKTLSLEVRWNSGGVLPDETGAFDVYLGVYSVDGETWTLRDQWNEVTSMSTEYSTLTFEIPDADENFDPTEIRQIEVRIAAKYWQNEEPPQPVFNYQPAQFEIDSLTWE